MKFINLEQLKVTNASVNGDEVLTKIIDIKLPKNFLDIPAISANEIINEQMENSYFEELDVDSEEYKQRQLKPTRFIFNVTSEDGETSFNINDDGNVADNADTVITYILINFVTNNTVHPFKGWSRERRLDVPKDLKGRFHTSNSLMMNMVNLQTKYAVFNVFIRSKTTDMKDPNFFLYELVENYESSTIIGGE